MTEAFTSFVVVADHPEDKYLLAGELDEGSGVRVYDADEIIGESNDHALIRDVFDLADVILVVAADAPDDAHERVRRVAALARPYAESIRLREYRGERLVVPAEATTHRLVLAGLLCLPEADPHRPRPRLVIEVTAEEHVVNAAALRALARADDLYQRGGQLVRVVGAGDADAATAKLPGFQDARSPAVAVVSAAWLRDRLTSLVEFGRWRVDRKGEPTWCPVPPPTWCVEYLIDRGEYPGVRPLAGLAEAPFYRRDGFLARKPGYDPESGVYVCPPPGLKDVRRRPTREDAADAARRILDVVSDFPFATSDDAAAWLAAVLTLVMRPAIAGPVPGFAVVGNRAGTGKGLLIDVAAMIANGRELPTSPYPGDPAEADKVKLSLALAAVPAVHLDNLPEGGTYGSGPLDSALTSRTVGGRLLGQSKVVSGVPLRTTWFLSGNNIAPGKDAHRRWLPINLVTTSECPEEREDVRVRGLLDHVRARRAALLHDALTILGAHLAVGCPAPWKAPLGSFEEWDRDVRGAVWYATEMDPTATRRVAAAESPDRLRKVALLHAWAALPGGTTEGLTVAEAIANHGDTPAFRDALAMFARGDKPISPHSLACVLRSMKAQRLDGKAFYVASTTHKTQAWMVRDVSG